MSRTLNDDFDDDDAPGGPIDLEKGSQVGTGVASSYGGEGMDFDDELYGDGPTGGDLELDIPGGGRSHGPPAPVPSKAPAPTVSQAPRGGGGVPGVPDLAFDAVPPPSSRDPQRDAMQARPSGNMAAVRPSGSQPILSGPPASNPSLPAPQSSGSLNPAAHSSGQLPAAPGSDPHTAAHGAPAEPAKPDHAAIIGKYPAPPQQIWQAPMYAVKVVMRQFEIRSDLESLRRRRSPDVALYERALRSYDGKSFKLGMAINIAAFTIATFIFFLPVFIRFLRND